MKMTFDLDDEPAKAPQPAPAAPAPNRPAMIIIPELGSEAPALAPVPAHEADQSSNHQATIKQTDDEPDVIDFEAAPDVPPATPETATVAPLPTKLFDRPVTATMKTRYDGHTPVNEQVRDDWMKVIEQDPFSYEALLYRPTVAVPTEPDEDGIETPLFTEINNNQVELDYLDPVIVTVMDCPDQRENFTAVDNDGDQDGLVDDFLIIRAATRNVSIGSIFEWNEETMDGGTVRRWWYVLRIYTLGTASVGSLYYCIPARNIEGSAPEVVDVQ